MSCLLREACKGSLCPVVPDGTEVPNGTTQLWGALPRRWEPEDLHDSLREVGAPVVRRRSGRVAGPSRTEPSRVKRDP